MSTTRKQRRRQRAQQRNLLREILAASDDGKTLQLTADLSAVEWQDLEAAEGENKLPRFNMTAYTGATMKVARFFRPIVVDLGGVKVAAKQTPIFRDHDPTKIVGHGEVEITAKEITASGVISGDNENTREIVSSSRNGFPWQASIGAAVNEFENIKDGQKVTVNGRMVAGPVLVARKTTLNEISFTALGADRKTKSSVAAKDSSMDKDFEAWLGPLAESWDEQSDEVKAHLEDQFKAHVEATKPKPKPKKKADDDGDDDPPSPHGAEFLATLDAARKERDRVYAINAIGDHAVKNDAAQMETVERLVKAAHKDESVTPDMFELQLQLALHRGRMPIGPSNINTSRGDHEMGERVIEAAAAKSLNLRNIEKHYDERTLDASDRYFKHGLGLQQLLFKAAAAHGHHYDSAGNLRGLLQSAFPQNDIRASGFSTFSLPGILSNLMNKLLLDHFNAVDATWRSIASVRPVRDFKQVSSYSLTGDLQYEKLGPTGEIKHGTVGEITYTNKADTYARMIAITRQDIINDDLGALQRVPQRLGRGAALKINDVFWSVFLNNSAFFTAGNNNVSTGGGSALGTADGAAINAAEVIFMNQTDPDGKPLGIMPKIMLVPPTLLNTGARWMGGQLIVTGADTTLPDANVYQGRYQVRSSPYMENATYTGFSAAAWYLLADPMDLPVIEVCFLNNRDAPIVESADADFDTLGIQSRAYHDFGAALQEPRGGVRSAGS